MNYELALETYHGPLDKLLELVEDKKMEITEISLAEVTADFLAYLQKLETEKVSEILLADFLVVASKLILIKSRILIPSLISPEEETDIRDLETRLRLYQELKKAVGLIRERWEPLPQMLSREYLAQMGPVFYPPQKVGVEEMHNCLQVIIADLEQILRPVGTLRNEIINLKAKIEEVIKKLTAQPIQFKELSNGGSREELIVLFLAILHLIKDQLIKVEQSAHFEEMTVARKEKND